MGPHTVPRGHRDHQARAPTLEGCRHSVAAAPPSPKLGPFAASLICAENKLREAAETLFKKEQASAFPRAGSVPGRGSGRRERVDSSHSCVASLLPPSPTRGPAHPQPPSSEPHSLDPVAWMRAGPRGPLQGDLGRPPLPTSSERGHSRGQQSQGRPRLLPPWASVTILHNGITGSRTTK